MPEEEQKKLFQELRVKYYEAQQWKPKYKEEKLKEIELGKLLRMGMQRCHAHSFARSLWLVKDLSITYHKYDPVKHKYLAVNHWVLIGSMGDPKTWAGGESVAIKKGSADGLAGCLVDLNVL